MESGAGIEPGGVVESGPAWAARAQPAPRAPVDAARLRAALGHRSVVLVGLMGAGKTSLGRRLATALGLPFTDSDHAIELAAGMSIPEIFSRHGEPYFRSGEARVITRLLRDGPQVLATGGGAFMNTETRDRVREGGVSVWLKAELDTLMRRVRKRQNRPLLSADDPEAVMRGLMLARSDTYALADLTVVSHDGPHEAMLADLIGQLARWLAAERVGAPEE